MVYEKFFAMLCQSDPKSGLLKRCGMVIVDELSMLEVDQRGPKLEIAISKAMGVNEPPRIVCLATTDCDTRVVRDWLRASGQGRDAILIEEKARPVSLDEYLVLSNGMYQMRHIPGEDEEDKSEEGRSEPVAGTLAVAIQSDTKNNEYERRMAVLRAILQRLYPPVGRDTPAAERPKTLIFVPSQRGTREIAKAVAKMAEEGSICLDRANSARKGGPDRVP